MTQRRWWKRSVAISCVPGTGWRNYRCGRGSSTTPPPGPPRMRSSCGRGLSTSRTLSSCSVRSDDTVLTTLARRDRLDNAILTMVAEPAWAPLVVRLGHLRSGDIDRVRFGGGDRRQEPVHRQQRNTRAGCPYRGAGLSARRAFPERPPMTGRHRLAHLRRALRGLRSTRQPFPETCCGDGLLKLNLFPGRSGAGRQDPSPGTPPATGSLSAVVPRPDGQLPPAELPRGGADSARPADRPTPTPAHPLSTRSTADIIPTRTTRETHDAPKVSQIIRPK